MTEASKWLSQLATLEAVGNERCYGLLVVRARNGDDKDMSAVFAITSTITTRSIYVSFGQASSLLWTHMLRPFYSRPIALTQEGRSLVNEVCERVRD